MRLSLSAALFAGLLVTPTNAFSARQPSKSGRPTGTTLLPAVAVKAGHTELLNIDTTGIQEEACLDTASRIKRTMVPVSTDIHPDGAVGVAYAHWPAASKSRSNKAIPPVVMVHGFDSNCLEYRRLGSQMAERGIDFYAPDMLGWGFSQLDGVKTFSADAKVEALQSFIDNVVPGKSFVLGGSSLGGACAITAAAKALNTDDFTKSCDGVVLMNAQGFIDGLGPVVSSLPPAIAGLGVEVLKTTPLRTQATRIAYYEADKYAGPESVAIGALHTKQDGWKEALVSFMQSGGFTPSKKVATITAPTLILWGREDYVLDGRELIPKFTEAIPGARVQWFDECGHVPHLEKPTETAEAIKEFLETTVVTKSPSTGLQVDYTTAGIAAVGAATVAGGILNLLPLQ